MTDIKKIEQQIENAFTLLFENVFKFSPFLSTQSAIQRLKEANFWMLHALNDHRDQEARKQSKDEIR